MEDKSNLMISQRPSPLHRCGLGINLSQEDAKTLLQDKDKDHDNSISLEEFSGEVTEAERAWRALDSKKKGSITKQELENGLKKYKKSMPHLLIDSCGDQKPFLKRYG